MIATTLSLDNMHLHGSLFANLFRARRESFIVRKKWRLPEADGMEFDQYDTPVSRWIAVHQGTRILAGVRLMPTNARVGMYSYMIRDAQRGMLEAIPSNLLDFEAPVDPLVWEATRIFVSDDVPASQRTRVQADLMFELISTAQSLGAKQLLAFGPAVWPRWMARLKLSAEPAGPILMLDGVRVQTAVMDLSAQQPLVRFASG